MAMKVAVPTMIIAIVFSHMLVIIVRVGMGGMATTAWTLALNSDYAKWID